jgi:hypothetical protein
VQTIKFDAEQTFGLSRNRYFYTLDSATQTCEGEDAFKDLNGRRDMMSINGSCV